MHICTLYDIFNNTIVPIISNQRVNCECFDDIYACFHVFVFTCCLERKTRFSLSGGSYHLPTNALSNNFEDHRQAIITKAYQFLGLTKRSCYFVADKRLILSYGD